MAPVINFNFAVRSDGTRCILVDLPWGFSFVVNPINEWCEPLEPKRSSCCGAGVIELGKNVVTSHCRKCTGLCTSIEFWGASFPALAAWFTQGPLPVLEGLLVAAEVKYRCEQIFSIIMLTDDVQAHAKCLQDYSGPLTTPG